MNVFRAAALLFLMLIGVIILVIALSVDQIVNGGELLGIALILLGAYPFVKVLVVE